MKHLTPDSIKFKRLQRRLGVSRACVVGTLELLWLATQKNAPRGDIGRFDNEAIAIECDWEGDPDLLVSSLVQTGWLDESAEFRLTVHDWHQHAPRYIHAWVKSQNTTFAIATTEPTTVATVEATTDGTTVETTEGGTRNLTKPNVTKPNQTKHNPSSANADGTTDPPETRAKPRPSKHAEPSGFAGWWEIYPRKVGKRAAAVEYARAIARIETARANAVDWLLEVTQRFARSPAGNAGDYTPHPTTWLRQDRFDDDPKTWERTEKNGNAIAIGPGQRFDPSHQPDWR